MGTKLPHSGPHLQSMQVGPFTLSGCGHAIHGRRQYRYKGKITPEMYGKETLGKPSLNYTSPKEDRQKELSETPAVPYFIGLDWLEVTLKGLLFKSSNDKLASNYTIPVNGGKVVLLNNPKLKGPKNKHYRFGFHVLFIPDGAKRTANEAAELAAYGIGFYSTLANPGNNCAADSSIFQVYNHVLYRSDLWTLFNTAVAALNATVAHFTRVDIFIDGRGLLNAYQSWYNDRVYSRIDVNHVRKYSHRGRVNTFEEPVMKKEKVTLFHWGNAKSAKSLKGYCKGERIEIENKLYIREAWKRAGLIRHDEDGKEIQRLEIVLRREGCKDLLSVDTETGEVNTAFTAANLDRPGTLAGIFKACCKNWFDLLVVNPNDSNKSRWKSLKIIDWKQLESLRIVRLSKTRKSSETWKAKHASHKMYTDAQVYDYPAKTVKRSLFSAPVYTVQDQMVEQCLTKLLTGRGKRSRLALEQFAAYIVSETTQHLADWTASSLPMELAEAMAQFHHSAKYLERRLEKDINRITPVSSSGFTPSRLLTGDVDGTSGDVANPLSNFAGIGLGLGPSPCSFR